MIKDQIFRLNEAGNSLLEKGKVKLALDAFEAARQIMKEYQFDSVKIFAQFCIYASVNPSFLLYAEFSARNNLEAISKVDYDMIMSPDQDLLEG